MGSHGFALSTENKEMYVNYWPLTVYSDLAHRKENKDTIKGR